jgi:hypothetical protein
MKFAEAATLDQRPLRSLLMRGWIEYEKGYGFRVTWNGKDAWHAFLHTSIERTGALRGRPRLRHGAPAGRIR